MGVESSFISLTDALSELADKNNPKNSIVSSSTGES
jgi:hypothetical protein